MEKIILVGYGGHAKSVADTIERQGKYKIIGYTDKLAHASRYNYLGTDEVLPYYFKNGIKNIAVCIGYLGKGHLRETIYEQLKDIGFSFPVIVDPSSIIAKDVKLGEGTFVGKAAIINADAKIGKMCIINTKALIEHECNVDNFTHVAVGATVCGQVNIGSRVLVGANATIIQCIEIENGAIIPAGATIRKRENGMNNKESNIVYKKLGGGVEYLIPLGIARCA